MSGLTSPDNNCCAISVCQTPVCGQTRCNTIFTTVTTAFGNITYIYWWRFIIKHTTIPFNVTIPGYKGNLNYVFTPKLWRLGLDNGGNQAQGLGSLIKTSISKSRQVIISIDQYSYETKMRVDASIDQCGCFYKLKIPRLSFKINLLIKVGSFSISDITP